MASKAKRPGERDVRGGRRSDASTSANRVSRAPARARTSVRPSAVAASGAPPITVAGSVQRPGSRSERSVRPRGDVDARDGGGRAGRRRGVQRPPARGGLPGGQRARGAGAEREGALGAGAEQHEVAGGAAGAAACSPHPATAGVAAARMERGGERAHGLTPAGAPGARAEQEATPATPSTSAPAAPTAPLGAARPAPGRLGDRAAGGGGAHSGARRACGRARLDAACARAPATGVKVAPCWPSSKAMTRSAGQPQAGPARARRPVSSRTRSAAV